MRSNWQSGLTAGSGSQKFLLLVCLTILVAGGLIAADDPWKSKPYEEWTAKDVERVLTDSPWVRMTFASLNGVPVPAEGSSDAVSTPGYERGESANPNGNRPGAQPPSGEGDQSGAPTGPARFLILWESSRTVRSALARRETLEGKMSEEEAQKYLAQPPDEYQIVVESGAMKLFQNYDERFTQENTVLNPKKSKAKVPPSRVEFQRDTDGRAIVAVVFSFPKKLPSGSPLILPDEKSIEFTCKLGGFLLDASFDPRKMTDQTGPDL